VTFCTGPNDPRWGPVGVPRPGHPGVGGGVPGVPPGARFDPFGPPGVPGFEPNRFTRYYIVLSPLEIYDTL
jgi:proteasome inhibitor subunit 1 (PI31)